MANALHQTTVADEYPGAVFDDGVAGTVEFRRQQLLAQRHADRIGQALPERTGGGFHSRGDADLGMTRGFAVQLSKSLELLDRQRIASQMQQRIE